MITTYWTAGEYKWNYLICIKHLIFSTKWELRVQEPGEVQKQTTQQIVQRPVFLPLHTPPFPSVSLMLQFKVVTMWTNLQRRKWGVDLALACYISPFIIFSSAPVYSFPLCVGCSLSPQLLLPAPWRTFSLCSQQGFWNAEVKLCRMVDALKVRHGRQPESCPWATGGCWGPFTKKGHDSSIL